MEITLEKIELVKDRTGVTYKEAKEALEKVDGSVVDAIIEIEESMDKNYAAMADKKSAIMDEIKAIIKKGNVSKIQVRKEDGEILINVPVNVGIAGAIFAPIAMLIGGIVAFGCKYSIEVIKDDGTVIDISDKTNDAIEKATVKGNEVYERVINSETYEKMREKTEETMGKATEAFKNKFAKDEDDKKAEDLEFAEDFDMSDLDETEALDQVEVVVEKE